MYEVELKAVLNNIESTIAAIETFNIISKEEVVYNSTYFDIENTLSDSQKELRLRTVKDLNSETLKTILTYKDPPFDESSRSKAETEIDISNLEEGIKILKKLGFQIKVSFEKICTNYRLKYQELELLVTIAEVQELDRFYIEVESPTESENDIDHRFKIIREFLTRIGIKEEELTNEYYSDAVKDKRNRLASKD